MIYRERHIVNLINTNLKEKAAYYEKKKIRIVGEFVKNKEKSDRYFNLNGYNLFNLFRYQCKKMRKWTDIYKT